MTLSHRQMQDRLDHFLDGELPEAERLLVEEHLGWCDECLAEVEALRAVQAGARALPRDVAPPRDLWPQIAARIHAEGDRPPGGVIQVDFRTPGARRSSRVWLARAAAAVALVLVSSGGTALLLRSGPAPLATLPAERVQPQPMTALAAFAPAEAEYRGSVAVLAAQLEARRGRLTPETIATVEANLRIIDAAIAEASAALRADPGNADIPLLLSGVYRKKVELLEHAVQLSSRT